MSSKNCCAKESQCFGTPANGYINNTKQLPIKGDNFVIYHKLGNILGRNYVHSKVYNIIIESYNKLAVIHPKIKWKYAETGWKNGGDFKPHKTHQNGLSVDFMAPVVNKDGDSVYFPSDFSNEFGYAVEFDKLGKYADYQIDFAAIAIHLVQLDKTAKNYGITLKRVILAPELRVQLFKTKHANYLQKNIKFMKNKAWVRHDEHYHIDFSISCKN